MSRSSTRSSFPTRTTGTYWPRRSERGAQTIVTANLQHFPADELRPWDIEAISPDDFIRDQIELDRAAIYAAIQQIADSWRRPPGSIDDVLDQLERSGLAISVAELRMA
jgi:hypothetical protein